MGEITTNAKIDVQQIARQVVLDIGYDRAKYGFDGDLQVGANIAGFIKVANAMVEQGLV